MNKQMLRYRTISKLSSQLLCQLQDEDASNPVIPVIKTLSETYNNMYMNSKQIEKEPSVVYQMFGRKTTELTPQEDRQYKAFLKRQRDKRKRELNSK